MVWSGLSRGATVAIKGHISQFFNTVPGQTLLALSFNLISLFAGGLISIFTPQFAESSWILALFPPILTVRGGIGGIFSGNLATMLHLGLVKTDLRNNTKEFWSLIRSVLVITAIDAFILGILSFAMNLVTGRVFLDQGFLFICVPLVACISAVSLSIPLTSFIAIETYKRGLDPDILVYPILASANDIIVTGFFALTVFSVLWGGAAFNVLVLVFILILVGIGCLAWMNRGDMFFHQTLREGTTVIIVSSLFGSINGVFLSNLQSSLMSRPGLIVMYPALTNALGNIGSILGSRSTTALALGYARSLKDELTESGKSIIYVETPAAFIHVVFAIASWLIAGPRTPGSSLSFLLTIALFTNVTSFLFVSAFSLIFAHVAFQRGLNPDNVVIPAITSVSDSTATLTISPAIVFARLLGL